MIDAALPYGGGEQRASIAWGRLLGVMRVAEAPALADPAGALRAGLANPLGQSRPFLDSLRAGDRVTIAVSDSFRKTGVHQLLPALIAGIESAGVRSEDIAFLYATGSHRGPTETEAAEILGPEIHARFKERAHTHDPRNRAELVHLGETRRGTPVWINRRAVECDCFIVTGTVVLHYFGGYGGGRKAVLPGLAGIESIAANHALNLHPRENRLDPAVRIGTLASNPVAEDMLEGARMCKTALLVNTVLNQSGAIAGLFTGDLEAAHAEAAAFAHRLYAVPLRERADIVAASAGDARNFIQSHKALFNAYQALAPGGRIVFAARAPEGYGGNKFAQWLRLGSRDAIIAALREQAEINGQTALSTVEKAAASYFVTDMTEEEVALMGGRKAADLAAAMEAARADLAAAGTVNPTIWLMPEASYTVPMPAE